MSIRLDEDGWTNTSHSGYTEKTTRIELPHETDGFVWIAVANCDATFDDITQPCQGPLDLEYYIECFNAGGYAVSVDDHAQLPLVIAMLSLQMLVFIFALRVKKRLSKLRRFHYTVQLLLQSVTFALLAYLVRMTRVILKMVLTRHLCRQRVYISELYISNGPRGNLFIDYWGKFASPSPI